MEKIDPQQAEAPIEQPIPSDLKDLPSVPETDRPSMLSEPRSVHISQRGNLKGRPLAVALDNIGNFNIFQITDDGKLRWVIQTANTNPPTWGSWLDLGAPGGVKLQSLVVGQNDTTVPSGGALEVFAVGENGEVWHCWQCQSSNNGWAPWASWGMPRGNSPDGPPIPVSGLQVALLQDPTNQRVLIVLAVGSDHLLWSRQQGTAQLNNTTDPVSTSGWSQQFLRPDNQPVYVSAISVATDANQQNLQVFGIGGPPDSVVPGGSGLYWYNTNAPNIWQNPSAVGGSYGQGTPWTSMQVKYGSAGEIGLFLLNESGSLPAYTTYASEGNQWTGVVSVTLSSLIELAVAMREAPNNVPTFQPLAFFGLSAYNVWYLTSIPSASLQTDWNSLSVVDNGGVPLSSLAVFHNGQGVDVVVADANGSVWVIYMATIASPDQPVSWSEAGTQGNATRYPDWMGDMADKLGNVQVQQASIPGTHDSGTSPFSTFGDPWQRTQNKSIAEQLQAGIRYLDLRLGLKDGVPWIVHGAFYAQEASAVINAVDAFTQAHPREIVLLDFNSIQDMDTSSNQSFAQFMITTFGSRVIPATVTVNVTFNTLWTNEQQIFIFYADQTTVANNDQKLWLSQQPAGPPPQKPVSGYPIFTFWPNITSQDTGVLTTNLTNGLAEHTLPQFFVLQGIFTPDAGLIVGGIATGAVVGGAALALAGAFVGYFLGPLGSVTGAAIGAVVGAVLGGVGGSRPFPGKPGSVQQLAAIANPAVINWLQKQITLGCITIVDYFDVTGGSATAFVDAVIGFNKQ